MYKRQVLADPAVLLIGLVQSLFEGAMYSFVFMWSPALMQGADARADKPPFGQIFATFMVCCMLGSQVLAAGAPRTGMSAARAGEPGVMSAPATGRPRRLGSSRISTAA